MTDWLTFPCLFGLSHASLPCWLHLTWELCYCKDLSVILIVWPKLCHLILSVTVDSDVLPVSLSLNKISFLLAFGQKTYLLITWHYCVSLCAFFAFTAKTTNFHSQFTNTSAWWPWLWLVMSILCKIHRKRTVRLPGAWLEFIQTSVPLHEMLVCCLL